MVYRSKFLNKNATSRRSLKMTNFLWNCDRLGSSVFKNLRLRQFEKYTQGERVESSLFYMGDCLSGSIFFFAWNAICNAWKFLEFFPWKSSTQMKKPKKTFKNTRENYVLLVKFSANHARISKIYRREKYRILHLWKGK